MSGDTSSIYQGTHKPLWRIVCLLAWAFGVFIMPATICWGQQEALVQELQAEVVRLRERVAELESLKVQLDKLERQLQELQKLQKAQSTPVATVNRETKASIDGRFFVGVFGTQPDGSFPNRTLDIPDGKVRFTFQPSPHVLLVNRFSASRSGASNMDYLYIDLMDWGGIWRGHTLRIGKHKLDIGQETWTDNPIENIVITNAVSHVSGLDEGLNLRGPLSTGSRPWTYSIELVNGSQDFSAAPSQWAWGVKIGGLLTHKIHLSASYMRTGNLVRRDGTLDKPDLNIAEVFDPPAGATGWRRSFWEVDLRYGYGKEGVKPIVGSEADEPWQMALAYGRFEDDAEGATDRKGSFGFVEALCNLTSRVYLGLRFSQIALDDGAVAKLGGSPVEVNEYRRYSFGLGYRLSRLTHLKTEYTLSETRGGTTKPDLNQFAIGIGTRF